MIKAFPKIFHIGTNYIHNIFDGEVEITEKVDGSQFVFGKDKDGHLHMRSKGATLYAENPQKMFEAGVEYVLSIQDKIPPDTSYYCEYLQRPKHNALTYSRIPKNHLILWGISNFVGDMFVANHKTLTVQAEAFGIEPVKLMWKGLIPHPETLLEFMDMESQLGGVEAEGLVVKNYNNQFLLGGQPIPVMAGKYVSEKFKEVHRTTWSKEHTNGGKWAAFKAGYNTEARWHKAVQHLRDSGELEGTPRDIGKLLAEIKRDITEEEKEIIKDFLWKQFGDELLRSACVGFPQWYKDQLLLGAFDGSADQD